MSAHTKHRKVFHIADGAHAEVTVIIHNVDPTPADLIVTTVLRAAEHAIADYREAIDDKTLLEEQARQARVAALRKQNDPDNKVVSHGSAELHDLAPATAEPSKSKAKRLAVLKSEAAR